MNDNFDLKKNAGAAFQDESRRLSVVVDDLLKLCTKESLTLGEFLHELNIYGHMMVCLIFSIPFLLPVPLPGLSIVFGLIIAIGGSQILLGQDPWVPKSWRPRQISTSLIVKILEVLKKILLRTEKVIKPRFKFFAKHPGFVRFNGAIILLLALLLALPMPPGFNFPPALAIIALSIGSIERDGMLIVFGYVVAALNAALFGTFFVVGFEGIKSLMGAFG
jgi:hypothetical protein